MRSKATAGFLLRFAIIFGLLIAPWPGWNGAYAGYFRAFGQWVCNIGDGQRLVAFAPNGAAGDPLDTRISMGNRALLDADGRGLLMRTELDTRSIGWVPTALTISLVAATPVPWRRRALALVAGLALVHLFIAFSLQTWVWNNSPGVALVTLSSFGKWLTGELEYACLNQLGISFTVPVLIWVLVTFKRQDVLAT